MSGSVFADSTAAFEFVESDISAEITDTVAPIPVCIQGLAIDFSKEVPTNEAGNLILVATDFIDSLITLGELEPLTYSINLIGKEANPQQDTLELICPDASLLVEVWVWDEKRNANSCETYVLLQNRLVDECGAEGAVSGTITTEEMMPVTGVPVGLSGNSVATQTTIEDGAYQFTALDEGFSHTITPALNEDPLNGVSTFDLVLISKHILGLQLLDSPYKRIASDINNSKTISVADVIELRRLLLNIDSAFQNNASWRFVPADFQFPNPQNPWQTEIPEVIQIEELEGKVQNLDFIAIKTGDISLDARTSATPAAEKY